MGKIDDWTEIVDLKELIWVVRKKKIYYYGKYLKEDDERKINPCGALLSLSGKDFWVYGRIDKGRDSYDKGREIYHALFYPDTFLDADTFDLRTKYLYNLEEAKKWIEDEVDKFISSEDKDVYFSDIERVQKRIHDRNIERDNLLVGQFLDNLD